MVDRGLGVVSAKIVQLALDALRGQLVERFRRRVKHGEGIRGAIGVVAKVLGAEREMRSNFLWAL